MQYQHYQKSMSLRRIAFNSIVIVVVVVVCVCFTSFKVQTIFYLYCRFELNAISLFHLARNFFFFFLDKLFTGTVDNVNWLIRLFWHTSKWDTVSKKERRKQHSPYLRWSECVWNSNHIFHNDLLLTLSRLVTHLTLVRSV